MLEERWNSHQADLGEVREIAQRRFTLARTIEENIDKINSLDDYELSLVSERDGNYIQYTSQNRKIVQEDPVCKRLENLRIPACQRTIENGYLLVDKAVEKLIDSLYERKMTKKHYEFFLISSDEDCIKALLCYFGINAAYKPERVEAA